MKVYDIFEKVKIFFGMDNSKKDIAIEVNTDPNKKYNIDVYKPVRFNNNVRFTGELAVGEQYEDPLINSDGTINYSRLSNNNTSEGDSLILNKNKLWTPVKTVSHIHLNPTYNKDIIDINNVSYVIEKFNHKLDTIKTWSFPIPNNIKDEKINVKVYWLNETDQEHIYNIFLSSYIPNYDLNEIPESKQYTKYNYRAKPKSICISDNISMKISNLNNTQNINNHICLFDVFYKKYINEHDLNLLAVKIEYTVNNLNNKT